MGRGGGLPTDEIKGILVYRFLIWNSIINMVEEEVNQ